MVKKGVSQAEKKERLLKILTDSQAPFTLKELEKLGSKAGVNAMAIKGVLQEMVDDDIINLDKIGSSNYYWCFPAEAISKKQKAVEAFEKEIKDLEAAIKRIEGDLEQAKADRDENVERTSKLEEIANLKAENEKLATEVAKYAQFEEHEKLVKVLKICKEGAIRWTDNTWALADYLKKKYQCHPKDVQRQLQMNDDFDYPEYVPPRKKIKSS